MVEINTKMRNNFKPDILLNQKMIDSKILFAVGRTKSKSVLQNTEYEGT